MAVGLSRGHCNSPRVRCLTFPFRTLAYRAVAGRGATGGKTRGFMAALGAFLRGRAADSAAGAARIWGSAFILAVIVQDTAAKRSVQLGIVGVPMAAIGAREAA